MGVVPALQRRRRRAHQDWDVLQPRPHDRYIAGVVARRRLLLERSLVLLVNDDQTEPARRGEYSAAGTNNDLHMSARHTSPVSAALGVAEVTVQHRDLV